MKRHNLSGLFVFLMLSGACPAATIVVDLGESGDYIAIQPAIDAAADGDTVLVKPGEYVITESLNFNRLHDPGDPESPPVKNIVLRSEAGADVTTVKMTDEPEDTHKATVLMIVSGETTTSLVAGLTFSGGKVFRFGQGGGIHCERSSPRIESCRISGNLAYSGAGVYCKENASPTLTNCTISDNIGEVEAALAVMART